MWAKFAKRLTVKEKEKEYLEKLKKLRRLTRKDVQLYELNAKISFIRVIGA